jgi:hypothetical protein
VQREALSPGANALPTDASGALRPSEAALSLEPLAGQDTGARGATHAATIPPPRAAETEAARPQPMAAPRSTTPRAAHPPKSRRVTRERPPAPEPAHKLYRKLDF